jgi:prolipoprotein diacylglyceryl transferase
MGIAGVIIGGRVGSILFYEYSELLQNPVRVLTAWRGGFASHGSALGLLAALWFYSRRRHMSYLEAMDRFSLSVPLAVSCVRLGNFLNSEIVGKPATVPWAVVFVRYDREMRLPPTPRHPWQLYALCVGIAVFAIMYLVDRKLGERRPRGFSAGLLLALYFTSRFFVEFVKEAPSVIPAVPLTTAQVLSIPFAVTGWILVAGRIKAVSRCSGPREGT